MNDPDPIPRLPLEHHRKQIGCEVTYSRSGRGKSREVTGIIQDVRHGYGTVYNVKTGQSWYVIEIKIKPNDGSRAFWTRFADRKETT